MEDSLTTSSKLITAAYESYRAAVCLYISYKINDRDEAEDLTQDVFLRLMDYKPMLREDTVKNFIYTIARNLVTDYLRRYYKAQEISSYMYDHSETCSNDTESGILARDLSEMELRKMNAFPTQRQKVYEMSRFEDKSAADIAMELNLSRRTVENHLFLGRKEMREYMQQCI